MKHMKGVRALSGSDLRRAMDGRFIRSLLTWDVCHRDEMADGEGHE